LPADDERACSQLDQARERRIDFSFGAGAHDMDLQPERTRRLLHVSRLGLGSGIFRVHEQTDDLGCGYQIVQQAESLRYQLGVQLGYAGDVATRPVQAGYEAERDRVTGRLEHDRNDSGGCFCCESRGCASRGDHVHFLAHQICRQSRKSIIVTLRPAVFERDIPVFDVAGFT